MSVTKIVGEYNSLILLNQDYTEEDEFIQYFNHLVQLFQRNPGSNIEDQFYHRLFWLDTIDFS